MTNEEKQALIERCEQKIKELSKVEFGIMHKDKLDLLIYCQAIAALTEQPVKFPHNWVYIRFTDRSKSQRMKCQVAWSDSLNSVIYDEEGAPLLISNSAYEVQE